jgi:hypothetical protein
MHVLPLPFGLALAVLPRREADLIRPKQKRPIVVQRSLGVRESARARVLSDIRYADCRQHIL